MQNNEAKNINIANMSLEQRAALAKQLQEVQASKPGLPEVPAQVDAVKNIEGLPAISEAEAQAARSNTPSDKPFSKTSENSELLVDSPQDMVDNVQLLQALQEKQYYDSKTKSSGSAADQVERLM